MALSKLSFKPGVNRDMTDYTNTGGWYDSDKVRFRNGLPEKIGGWQKFIPTQFTGKARELLRWSSLSGTIYTAIGTSKKAYISGGNLGNLTDVTPIVATHTLGPSPAPLSTTIGSRVVTVYDSSGHGAYPGDYVIFSGATAVGGLTINGEYTITSVVSNTTYTITAASNATSTATGGGTITAKYELPVGLDDSTIGSGWGASPWGGAVSPTATYSLGSNPISTTSSSNVSGPPPSTTLTITVPSGHGIAAGDSILISGATTVNGVDAAFINRAFDVLTSATTTITVSTWTNATSTGPVTGGGSSVSLAHYAKSTSTGWGSPFTSSNISLQIRLWSFDNYGEDLLLNPRDSSLFYWVEDNASSPDPRAVYLSSRPNASHVPKYVSTMIVSELGKHVLAFGASPYSVTPGTEDATPQDKMLIRWSSDERPEFWDETDTTENAGSIRLSNGSMIMTASQTRQEVLVWTDTALYSLQYSGAPYIFTSSLLSSGIDIIGPNSVATAVNTSFWMGSNNFYYYDGTVNRMPCTVREKVFNDINLSQRFKVYAGVNSSFNEVIWFYPSANSTENDSYVTYNYAEKCWYYGTLDRTAWIDGSFGFNPLATSSGNYLYYQEVGNDDGSTNPPSAINAYITSSPVEIEEGGHFSFVNRIIPDVSFRTTGDATADESAARFTVDFTLYPQNYPGGMPPLDSQGVPTNYYGTGQTKQTAYNYRVNTFTQQMFTRIRGRSVILRVGSTGLDVAWRLGTPRLDIRMDGRR